jgi:hypothetical protein
VAFCFKVLLIYLLFLLFAVLLDALLLQSSANSVLLFADLFVVSALFFLLSAIPVTSLRQPPVAALVSTVYDNIMIHNCEKYTWEGKIFYRVDITLAIVWAICI